MQLAFTTLGCPDWDLRTIATKAREYGYDGIDFRGYRGDTDLPGIPEFASGLEDTAQLLRDSGTQVPCLSSSARVFQDPHGARSEIAAYARICGVLGARYIRVFGGDTRDIPPDDAARSAAGSLRELAAIARDHGVILLLETHDSWVRSEMVRAAMLETDSASVGVLWDVHHPYRLAGEEPVTTWKALGQWVQNTHWKDSVLDPDSSHGFRLCLPGEGDLPLAAILRCMTEGGYDGWLTLEWEKMWHPDLPEPEVAFPCFVGAMRKLMAEIGVP